MNESTAAHERVRLRTPNARTFNLHGRVGAQFLIGLVLMVVFVRIR